MENEPPRFAADGLPAAAWWDDGRVAVADPDPLTGPTEPVAPHLSRLYGDGERVSWCDVCGAVPARRLRFRIITGLVLLARWEKQELSLCRTCGVGMGRRAQTATLLSGWWSPIAFVLNVWTIAGNAHAIRRAAQLPEPERPLRDPYPPVRPVWRHPAAIVPVVLLAFLGVLAGRELTAEPDGYQVGACIDIDFVANAADAVSCDSPHHGRFVAQVDRAEQCPAETDRTILVRGGDLLCVDTDR